MEKVKSNKTILNVIIAFVLLLSAIVANGFFTYKEKASAADGDLSNMFVVVDGADYGFTIIPTASIELETLDDSDNNTVGLVFNSAMTLSKYDESNAEVQAYLVDKTREINFENIAVGLSPYRLTKEAVDDKMTFHAAFYISRENYSIEYRCIWFLKVAEEKRVVGCLADSTGLKTDFSVMNVATTIVNTTDSGVSDHYQIKLKELINNVNSENQIKKDMDDLKQAGKIILEDTGVKKIIAVVCGSFLLLFAFSVFTSAFMRKGR